MKLYVNARCLEYKISGIERYTINLIERLRHNYDVTLLSKNKLDVSFDNIENVYSSDGKATSGGALSKLFWEIFSSGLMVDKNSIYHSVNTVLPFTLPFSVKAVVTVHDFAYKKFPECFSFNEKLYYKLLNYWSFARANKIICISDSTLNDFCHYYPSFKNKAVVVHNGYENFSKKKYESVSFSNLEPNNYYLVVGTLNKRKNLDRIIEAYKIARQNGVTSKSLVIVGDSKKLSRFENVDGVLVTGFVSDRELASYYANCWCYFFPSLYEGFGFPILEAQSFGKPVMTSNISSMKEISGYDEGELVNPESLSSIVDFIVNIESDVDFYNLLSEKSKINSFKYSWEKMYEETYDVFQGLYS